MNDESEQLIARSNVLVVSSQLALLGWTVSSLLAAFFLGYGLSPGWARGVGAVMLVFSALGSVFNMQVLLMRQKAAAEIAYTTRLLRPKESR